MPIAIPIILLLGAGVGVLVTLALASTERDVPVHEPDLPTTTPAPLGFPRSTRYRLVDKILPLLQQAAFSSTIPLGVLVGWIAKESGGRIDEVTKYGERGYFQLMPEEQTRVGFTDTDKLSSDPQYSINAGLALIGVYMGAVDKLGLARGTEFYWKMVKLMHSMGSGAVDKIWKAADSDNRTWQRFEDYAESHEDELKHLTKHSPTKWFEYVDKVADVGRPFGFGSQDVVVGDGAVFNDAADSDPLLVLKAI
jgi:hypothetical protein